jgi:hypothetical protein
MTGPPAWPGSGWRPAGPGTGLAGTRTRVRQLVTQHGDNCRRLRANPPMGGGEVKPMEASVNPDKGVLRAVTGGNLALERTVA